MYNISVNKIKIPILTYKVKT